jgi:hypothetical protein
VNEDNIRSSRAPHEPLALPDLTLSTEPERQVWHPGETICGLLRLTNQSATRTIRLETGSPTTGVLLDTSGAQILGRYAGWIAGVGRFIGLDPGDDDTVDFLAGSDAPAATRGTSLPPGPYLLSVRLRVSSDGGDHLLIAPPTAIRLDRA